MKFRHFITIIVTAVMSFLIACILGGLITLSTELFGIEGWEALGWAIMGMIIATPLWLGLSIWSLRLASGKILHYPLSWSRSTLLFVGIAGGILFINFIAEALMYEAPEALIQIWILLQFPFTLLLGSWALKEILDHQYSKAKAKEASANSEASEINQSPEA